MRETCGRILNVGRTGEGEILKVDGRISFLGDVDPENGRLRDGRSIKGKILVAKGPKGSTVGAYVIYALKFYSNEPLAIIFEEETDPIVVSGSVVAEITHGDRFGTLNLKDGEVCEIVVKEGKLCLLCP